MKRLYVATGLILVILIATLYIFLRLDLDETVQKTLILNNEKQPKGNELKITHPEKEIQLSPQQDLETPQTNQNSGEGAGGSGAGSTQTPDEQSQEEDCAQSIAYTLLDFSQEENCNAFQGSDCIDKTINCSVYLKNLDFELGGEFTIKFDFKEKSSEEILASQTQTQSVAPQETLLFSRTQNFQMPNSNKSVECQFPTESSPQRNIC